MNDTRKAAASKTATAGTSPAASPHPRSTPGRVADAISTGILMRRFTVGQRLIEADLTRDLGVSHSTVREALRILASSGVVDLTPHRGAMIRFPQPRRCREPARRAGGAVGPVGASGRNQHPPGKHRQAFRGGRPERTHSATAWLRCCST